MELPAPVGHAKDLFNRGHPIQDFLDAIGMDARAMKSGFVFEIQLPCPLMDQ
jgi:hypothetical protein